ncbi:MAG: branched-chain amino acid ABC transporter permease, partial [Candidatus Hodarchaeales archaeon]
SHVNVMIVTFALALIFESIIPMIYFPEYGTHLTPLTSEKRNLSGIVATTSQLNLFGVSIETIRVISLVLSVLVLILLYAFIWFSKTGVALRAVSQDEEAAALAGIDIRKTTAIVSGVGMGLIGFAAVLTSPFNARPWFFTGMGWAVLIWAIAVVTLGGMGSLIGSIIAAFILGFAEVVISSIDPSYSVLIPFIIVLIVMILKPEGLFGEKKELEG